MKHIFAAHLRHLLAAGILFGFAGCKAIDPAEDIPSYIHINSISLSVQSDEGSSSSKITEAWIYMDGQLLGGFELPCTVPVLAEGTHNILVKGGVKMNGLSSTRAIYPSWKGWEGSVTLTRGQSTVLAPVVTYFPGIDFASTWMDNFESVGTTIVPEFNSSGTIVRDSVHAFEGNRCGYIHLNNTDTTFFIGSSSVGYIMPPTSENWLEFDYWSDAEFVVGIELGSNIAAKTAWVWVQPKQAWGKIYIRLDDVIAAVTPQNVPYKIYFAASTPITQSEVHIYLDNIKLLK